MSSSELGGGNLSSPRRCCPLFQRWSVTCQHHWQQTVYAIFYLHIKTC